MANFTGTIGLDIFFGTDYVADTFIFDPTTLAGTDIIAGGLSTGFGDFDVVALAAGTYAAADFAGMTGIDEIRLDGPATLEVDTAMIDQGGTGGVLSFFVIRASAGDDIIDASAADRSANTLAVVLGGGSDTVYGSLGDDQFSIDPALGGNHSIFAGDGNDEFVIYGTGVHTFDGGAGDYDRIVLDGNVGAVELDLRAAGIQLSVDGGLLQAAVSGIEIFLASFVDDILRGDGGDQEFWGLTGDDTLDGRGGDDFLVGDIGDDTLRGGAGDDALFGDGGIDTADYANTLDDLDIDLTRAVDQAVASGVTGTDTLNGIENVTGGHGDDIIVGDDAVNVIRGGDGTDTLFGHDGNDTLFGNAGNDVLDGGASLGDDLLLGGAGLDIADLGGATTDVFVDLFSDYGSDGLIRFQTLISIEGAIGGSANDGLYGDDGANRFDGGAGDDVLVGYAGDDQLRGGIGQDTLDAGSGEDLLIGGGGADLFIIGDSGAGFGADTIQDFQDGLDMLELHGVGVAVVNDVAGDVFIDMFDATLAYLETVRLIGAAGQIDASDYVLVP